MPPMLQTSWLPQLPLLAQALVLVLALALALVLVLVLALRLATLCPAAPA